MRLRFLTPWLVGAFLVGGVLAALPRVRAAEGAAVPAPSAELPATAWRTLSQPVDGFVVPLPGVPRATTQDALTPIGGIAYHSFTLQAKDGVGYSVYWFDYPPWVLQLKTPAQLLQQAADWLVRTMDGRLTGQGTLTTGRVPGRWVSLSGPGQAVQARFYLSGARLYQVEAAVPSAVMAGPDVRIFLASFRLLRRTPG
ncbi:MAG TPA: hypothetical protein VEN82_02800 [Actinomycetota bacterium]|nr:hypothetical protein [Actinomycetota bacterium]